MSGKPASVGASRAGVPGGPARVLVYVADPRQLEPGAVAPDPPPAAPPPSHHDATSVYLPDNLHQLSAPRNSIYRTQLDCTEPRNQNTVFYKTTNEVDGKLSVFSGSNNISHHPDYLQIPQQFVKDLNSKVEDDKVSEHIGNLKADCVNSVSADVSAVESFQSRIALEGGDLVTYQRCPGSLGPDSAMPSMHQVALQHCHNHFSESVTVQSGGEVSNSTDRELSRSYVNYQVLEQSVSHQSIVNQSISILNQQVGVSRGVVSDSDSGHTPQLVRTADGVVLAVLPSSVLPQPVDDAVHNSRTVTSDSPQTIVVPLGWRRIINGTSVLYVSPSGTALSTLLQLRDYLQTAGTCKCGLPCPLRPETAFSFDPKVVSKPYQPSSGAELTKLCNHKRKLLATLQARAHSPATPPPQHHIEQKKATTEVAVLKKKMKKRANFPPNVTVSQMMVQRERPLTDFKPQESDHNRTVSPGIGLQRANNSQSCLPTFAPVQQNVLNALPTQDNDAKQDTHVQRSSHYLTVSSGWITQQQQENIDGQKPGQPSASSANASLNVGLPVLGTNGQVIGVNTGFNKQNNYKSVINAMPQNMLEQDIKDEKKDIPAQQNLQPVKNTVKEEESQIFCGLNQPLTPEVMQKINEQQQIFIQQNQKQIEMAMKGYKTQLAENVNQCKPQNQNQYVPQAQLVIQNGAVVKTNPAKTPPWQVKRNDSNNSNPMTSPNPKMQKSESLDYDESNTSVSDDSLNSYSSYPNNEQAVNQAMCSRVPPLPQHYNMLGQQWPNTMEINKKKLKANNNKGTKKKASPTENKLVTFGGNGMRIIPDNKNEMPSNNLPSFMDDPSGYLAQQTVLLNNTISRQGINSSYDANQYENPNCYGIQNQMDISCKTNKSFDVANTYRSNLVPNPSPSPNNTPDSSVLSDKSMDGQVSQCCKGCNIAVKGCGTDFAESQMRLKYMQQCSYKMETDGNLSTSSPKHSFEDNPVTSSTYIDRSPMIHDNCGPIQAGTVSTSNVSPTETLQPPEPSPTLSNSSRSTDTPHSSGSSSTQMQSNCSYPISSPAYSNPGSCKEHFNSNPSTPGGGHMYSYNSPGPPQSVSGTQMMHFISNHNVNKNLMEVDNISMVGVKPGLKPPHDSFRIEARRRIENAMPGYCPPPHLGGGPAHSLIQACYVQTFVTTMASGFSVTRDTVTSVLAGKANTATTSINASQANFIRPPPPPSVNLATTYAIPNNQPDPFINSVNLPTSYPLHIAGTTAQNMISKSPLEMVQNVIGSIPSKPETSNTQTTSLSHVTRRPGHTTPGQILISSTGQIIVSNNQMPPPPPKTTTAVSPIQGSSTVTNVTTSVTQVVPAVGGVQPMVNQPTVVVNTLPAPFVIQPPMMAVDGQVVQQSTVVPQIITGGIVPGQSPNESPRQIDMKNGQSFMQAMLSPESLKKRNKKKKTPTANITNVLQITAPQQNPNHLMVHHSSPQHNTSPQFSPRGFQLSPNNNISPTPMLQALTIVPGKSGTPAHIVMNGQASSNNFGSQQIITNTSPSQQINLLQPVNLINNASGVMPNFPAFQQFIVPNLGGMVMTADGTAIIQDNSTGMPMQLQLQTVNGQNVLTPVQNPNVFAGANGGVVIRAQNQQGKTIQSQHSPGAQFLSPNGQVAVNGPNFNGQLSPLLANSSPTGVQFNASPQVRARAQESQFVRANQSGPAIVPLSPKRAASRGNSTFVQNTTIVQRQTTLVANSHGAQLASAARSRLGPDPGAPLAPRRAPARRSFEAEGERRGEAEAKAEGEAAFVRHSVSTQTLAGARGGGGGGGSPPDTTTHSPLGAEPAASPRRRARPDTTTESPEPADASSSAMVQCVSSSEQDMAEARELAWPARDFALDNDTQNNMISNVPLMRQNRIHNPVESTELHYNQNINTPAVNNQHNVMPMTSNYYERHFNNKQTYKRKNDFGDGTFRTDKIMRTNYGMVHGLPKESDYDNMGISSPDKSQARQFPPTGNSSDTSAIQKVFDRHNIGSGDDVNRDAASPGGFATGDVVWGPTGPREAMWPGALGPRAADGRWSVRWFGTPPLPAPALLPARRLLALSEGLEAHHAARTNHRKSRKLNTLLENAIQEAMAELDKKSEDITDKQTEDTETDVTASETITETPKRSKKEKVRNKDKHHKKNAAKLAPNVSKTGENSRLRSSR